MEVIGHLIGVFIRWLDRRSQKPLDRVVGDLEQLLVDPADYFRYQELSIGPWRRWGSGLSLALLLWFGLFVFMGLSALEVNPPDPVKHFLIAALLLSGPLCFWAAMHWLRGGSCVLDAAGARFVHRGVEVFCPWSLFSGPGQAIIHSHRGRNRMELPVAAEAVPLVEARRNDVAFAYGMTIKTRQLRFRSADEAILKDLYRVKPDELAWLLLHLGRSLGSSPALRQNASGRQAENEAVEETASSPPAVLGADGWMTVRLTRLVFPPRCCACGAATTERQTFRAFTPLLRLGRFLNLEGSEHFCLDIPVCPTCRREARRRYRRTFAKTFLIVEGIAAGGGFLIGSLIALLAGDPKLFPFLPLVLAFSAGFLGLVFAGFIGNWAGRKASAPVKVERYLPDKGTVALRFRRSAYTELMLQSIAPLG